MVSDPGNNKPRDVFHKRVLKSYHKRQEIQQRMMSTCTNSSDEDGAVAAYGDDDEDSIPKKRFRLRKNNGSTTTSIESSSKGSRSSTIAGVSTKFELKYGFISMIGRRRLMEDAVKVAVKMANNEFVFFGAYDGHGGSRVSHACRDRLHYVLEEELMMNNDDDNSSVDWEKVMVTCFSRMDDEVMRWGNRVGGCEEDVRRTVGSAAVMVVVVGKEEIVVANCGDCRSILCNRGVVIPLSHDHKVTHYLHFFT